MLRWALIFLVIALVSAGFSFAGVSGGLAKATFFVTGLLFLVFLTVGFTIEKRKPGKL